MNNYKTLISVIIPVYQVEDFIKQCIESVILQKVDEKNLEIILVDDGSYDSCPQICDDYASKYNFIQVIHKENGGLSDARNVGLEVARGEYVFFVDSDDYISFQMYTEVLPIIQKYHPDVITFDGRVFNESQKTSHIRNTNLIVHAKKNSNILVTGKDFIRNEIRQTNNFHCVVWLNIYRREYLLTNNFYFIKGILHEDEAWTPRVILTAESIYYTSSVLYYYRKREGSITTESRNNKKHIKNLLSIYSGLMDYYKNSVSDKQLYNLLMDNLCKRILYNFAHWDMRKSSHHFLLSKRFLLKNSRSGKNRIKVIIYSFSRNLYFFIARLKKPEM